jgi:molybdenum cofactor sulfurtransferase
MITCFGERPWVMRKEVSLHSRLEDGTIAIRSILALRCAIDVHRQLFGDMADVGKHTSWLAKRMYDRLNALRHANGVPVCDIYKAQDSTYGDRTTQGATIAMNVRKSNGSWVGPYAVGAMLRARNIHVRTGSLCNPAGMACALGLSPDDIGQAYNEGFRCNQQEDIRRGGVLFGMVRVTVGAMSTQEDVDVLADFVEAHLVDHALEDRSNAMVYAVQLPINEKEKALTLETNASSSTVADSPGRRGWWSESTWRMFGRCFS